MGIVFKSPDSLARLNVPLHPTQLYDAANGLAIFFFLNWMEKRKTFDGQIFWLFLFLYSVTRFLLKSLGVTLGGSCLEISYPLLRRSVSCWPFSPFLCYSIKIKNIGDREMAGLEILKYPHPLLRKGLRW